MDKEIRFSTFIIALITLVMIELVILLLIIPGINRQILKEHCKNAVCNGDATICYKVDFMQEDAPITWSGSCEKVLKK